MGSELEVSSIFPSHGSMFRRALRSTGSLGSVPPLRRYYGALRLPAAPLLASLALAITVPSLDGANGTSQVPRHPSPRAPRFFDSGGISGAGPPGHASLRFAPSMLPSDLSASSASTTWTFRSPIPQLACSLSTLRDPGCPRLHARLASGWRPCLGRAGVRPAGLRYKVSVTSGLHDVLLVEACLAHRKPSEAQD